MINWKLRSYTEEDFREAYINSKSSSDVLAILGLKKSGKSSEIIDKTCEELCLPLLVKTEHRFIRYSLEEILVENSPYKSTTNLRNRLVSEGIFENKCYAPFCPFSGVDNVLDPFSGEKSKLRLALDHINGVNTDNRIENLRILCTHCHSLTDTFCGSNKVRKTSNRTLPTKDFCTSCLSELSKVSASGLCRTCSNKSRRNTNTKINWPSVGELISMVNNSNYTSVANILGVSDNAVRKRIQRYSSDG